MLDPTLSPHLYSLLPLSPFPLFAMVLVKPRSCDHGEGGGEEREYKTRHSKGVESSS